MKNKNQAGTGFIELLLNLAIASLLLVTLSRLYLTVKGQFAKFEEQIAAINDRQMISQFLTQKIRRAGFTPCASIQSLKTPPNQALEALVIKSNNIIKLSSMEGTFTEVGHFITDNKLLVKNSRMLSKGSKVLVADCFHAELASINTLHGKTVELENPLIYHYDLPAYLGEWVAEEFIFEKLLNRFFYRLHKKEALTDRIKNVELRFLQPDSVNYILSLQEENPLSLTTRLRNG